MSESYAESGLRSSLPVLICTALFHILYVKYLVPVWGYAGFSLGVPDRLSVVITYFLVWLPLATLPRFSKSRVVVVYFLLTVVCLAPSQICLLLAEPRPEHATAIQWSLSLGLCVLGLAMRLKPLPAPRIRASEGLVVALALLACGAAVGLLVTPVRGSLHWIKLSDASSVRGAQEGLKATLAIAGAGYLLGSVGFVIAPLLVVVGLARRRVGLVVAGCGTSLVIYATTTGKFALFAGPFAGAMWYVCRRGGLKAIVRALVWGSATTFTVVLAVNRVLGLRNVLDDLFSFLVMRYFGFQGLSTVKYAEFAQANGFTYWSHVKGISSVIRYPFEASVPLVVGRFWLGAEGVTTPGHPWAQDGLLAAGIPGVFVISFVVALVLWITESFTTRLKAEILVPLLLIQAVLLTESSIFTAMLSNGWALLWLLGWASPREFRVMERAREERDSVVSSVRHVTRASVDREFAEHEGGPKVRSKNESDAGGVGFGS